MSYGSGRRGRVSWTLPSWGPMWCVKRLRVAVLMVVGCRGCWLGIMACRVMMRRWAKARTAWPKAVCLGLVCAGSRPGRRGRSAREAKAEGNMARLSLLLPPWETHLAADR